MTLREVARLLRNSAQEAGFEGKPLEAAQDVEGLARRLRVLAGEKTS